MAPQFLLAQGEQVLERLGGQAGNAEGHGGLLGNPVRPTMAGRPPGGAPVLVLARQIS
jgi:hypothetical protein